MIQDLTALLDDAVTRYKIDKDLIYLTGISMGGFGTWSFAASAADRFAAIIPICGGGEPIAAGRLAKMPIWVFHGERPGRAASPARRRWSTR